jgi:hypothetical protein
MGTYVIVGPISGSESSRRTSKIKCIEEGNLQIRTRFAYAQAKTATIRHMHAADWIAPGNNMRRPTKE